MIIWKLVICQRIASKNTSMGRHRSPRYGQVMLVSRYPVFTAVNWSQHWCATSFLLGSQTTIMDKSWDSFAFLGRFSIHTGPTPPLTLQTVLDACIQNFSRVSTLFGVGGGGGRENCKKISRKTHSFKREPRNDRKIWILQYCPKDFCPGL